MRIAKKISCIMTVVIMLVTLVLSVSAVSESDYSVKEYATSVKETGTNTFQVSGDGLWDLSNPDKSCAIIYKNKVAVKDFQATFTIDKAYGEGAQDGWYALIFNNKPTFFSCIKPTLVAKQLKGLSFLFKTTTANKKQIVIEVSRYNGSVGYSPVFNQSIFVDLKKDWVINFQMKAGHLVVEGKDLADLNDAIDLSFPSNESYVGFGGFSEQGGPVGFTVNYDPSASQAASTTPSDKNETSSDAEKTASASTTETTAAAATQDTATTGTEAANTATTTATEETNAATTTVTEETSTSNMAVTEEASSVTTASEEEITSTTAEATTATGESISESSNVGNNSTVIIVVGLFALVIIGLGIYFFIIRKPKK